MKVLFLCGGIGRRMFPVTGDKFLLKFLGKTLLEHQVETMKKAGLQEYVFIGNPRNIEQLKSVVSRIPDINAEFAIQSEPGGIGDTVATAEKYLDGTILIQSSNDFVATEAFNKLLSAVRQGTADSYLLGYRVKQYFPGGYLVLDGQGNLTGIVEKPEPGKEPSDLVNIMVHVHSNPQRLLDYIRQVTTDRDDVYESAIDRLAREGSQVRIVPYDNLWLPVKYPWHILPLMQALLDQAQPCISPTAHISPKATVDDNVVIGDNVRIQENAVIRGPAYIGANSIIGNNSLIRGGSHIGANCIVGFACEIKNSYIGEGCRFHMNYVGDSVIGENCLLGAGTVTANLRFDERNVKVGIPGQRLDTGFNKLGAFIGNNCKTGVNVSIMPGVRIAPGSIISPQTCVQRDIMEIDPVAGEN